MDDLDGMPLAKRRRLLLSTTPSSSCHAPFPPKRRIDKTVEPVSVGVLKEWPGLPKGAKFYPSDADLLWHLLAKVGKGRAEPHPFIHEFITCLDEFDRFGYTHPQKLPGFNKHGSCSYFFHKSFKTCDAESRQHWKMHDHDSGNVCWQKSGKDKPLTVDGRHQGYKTRLTLYISMKEAENPNWVMHQFRLGVGKEDEGEFVVSKIFYQRTGQVNKSAKDMALEAEEAIARMHGVDHHPNLITVDASSQDILMDDQCPKDSQLLKATLSDYMHLSNGSELADSQVHTVNSDLISDSKVEDHTAKSGGNGLLQPSNISNQFMKAEIEHSDCNTGPFMVGLDGISARITGVCSKDDDLDHVLLHERSYMLLSSTGCRSIYSRCYIDNSNYGLNCTLGNSLHDEDGGLVPQNDLMTNLETMYGKDILGLVQDISSGPLVNNITESDPGKVQDAMHSPNLEHSWMECHLPENGTPNIASNVMAEPPVSVTAGSYYMVHQCSPNLQNNILLKASISKESHGNNCISSYQASCPEVGAPVLGVELVNTDGEPPCSGLSARLIQLKTEPVEVGCVNEIYENIGTKVGADELVSLEKCFIGSSYATTPSSAEVRICPESRLIKTNKSQVDQTISNCSKEAHTLEPKLLSPGQRLADQNDSNYVFDSVPPSNGEVKVEPSEDSCTYKGLEATNKNPVSSSLEATARKPMSSSLSGSSAETKKHARFSQRNNHCKDKPSSGCCNSQKKISTNSICSEQSLNKDLHLNSCSSKSLNSTCSFLENSSTSSPCLPKTNNRQENVLLHETSLIKEVGRSCSQHASFTAIVQFNNIEYHNSRAEVKKESVDDLSKDMQDDMFSTKPDMDNNNVNNSQQFLPQNQNCEPVSTIDAQVSHLPLRGKRKKTATDSVERALEEDAPGLLQVLLDKGITVDEIKLYGATEDNEALQISSADDNFKELETVITKIFCARASLFKFSVARHMKGTKAVYCLACLLSLIEQTRYLQFRNSPVEWGWCRDLQSFVFIFQRHNRIVLERPEYGYATYFFELVDSLPIDWQIKRLVTAMKLTSCSRTALIENKPLLVGEDLTKGEALVLEEYGWTPNCGLGTMLNYCDRVVHDKKNERHISEWRAKIGRLLMDGHDSGRIVLVNLPKRVVKYAGNANFEIKMEN